MIAFKMLGKHGRLGNSLFQAAATIALAKRNNDDFLFPCDWNYIDDFNIPKKYFSSDIICKSQYQEPNFHYNAIDYNKDMNLHGYFQSERYFEDYKDDIKLLLTPLSSSSPMLSNTASIHVRRGDYLKFNKAFEQLDLGYYIRAVYGLNVKNYIIFSDDIDWCKGVFHGDDFSFSEGKSEIEDLVLMSKCEHNIIANSSFSWWAAWLNNNPNKKVIAPSKWFGPELSPTHNTKDLIPKEWIII